MNAAWAVQHPSAPALVDFTVDDDVMLWWMSDRSTAALQFARMYLLRHPDPANKITDAAGVYSATVRASGLTRVYTGAAADTFVVKARTGDSHAPDLIGMAQPGVVYTAKVKKIAEHGGDAPADRDVALVVSSASAGHHTVDNTPVQTAAIAPTILALLGLQPTALKAVRIEHTPLLPGLCIS